MRERPTLPEVAAESRKVRERVGSRAQRLCCAAYCSRPAAKGNSRCRVHAQAFEQGKRLANPGLESPEYIANRRTLLENTAAICALCGEGPRPGDPWTADHIVRRADGGTHSLANLQRAHLTCNSRKG